jgi:hypothetical protein
MKRLWNTYQAWRARRIEHLKQWERRWEEKRAKGKARFVVRTGLVWSGAMIVGFLVADYYFDGTVDGLKSLFRAICFLIVGLIIGFVVWWTKEGQYKNAKIEARINSIEKQ